MVKWLRFTLIGLALVSVLLVLLPAGGTAYLNSPRGQQLIRDRINRMIQGEISWKKLELSLYSGGIEIQDLLVTGPDRRLLAGAEQVRANLAMLWLPAGRISLENLELQKPRIALARDNQGRWPLAEAFSRPGPRNDSSAPLVNPRIDLSIDTFLASGGSLDFSDSPSAIAVSMDEVSVWGEDLRLSTPAGKIRLEIGRGGIEAPGFNAPIDRLNLTANLEAERLAPVEVDLALGDSSFRLAGSVERLSAEPWIDLALQGNLALSDLQPLLNPAHPLNGTAALEIKARGPLRDPEVTSRVEWEKGSLLDVPFERLELGLKLVARQLEIDRFSVDSSLGKLEGSGAIDLREAFPSGLGFNGRNLDKLAYQLKFRMEQVPLEGILSGEHGYQGKLESEIKIDGRGFRPGDASTEVNLTLKGNGIRAPGMSRPVDIQARVDASIQGSAAEIREARVEGEGLLLAGRAGYDFSSERLAGKLKLDSSDLAGLLALAGIRGAGGMAVLDASFSGNLGHPRADLTLSGEELAYAGYRLGSIRLEGTLDDSGALALNSLSLENRQSRAGIRGRIGLLQYQPGGYPRISRSFPLELTIDLDSFDPVDFLPGEDLQGRLNGSISAEGSLASPRFQASLEGKEIVARGFPIGNAAAGFEFSGGAFDFTRLQVTRRGSSLSARGRITLLDERMKVLDDPGLDLEILESRISAQDFIAGGEGDFRISGKLRGSLKDPSGELTLAGSNLSRTPWRVGDLDAAVSISRGRISLSPLEIRNQSSIIKVSGSIGMMAPGTLALLDDPGLDLRLSGSGLRLEDFHPGFSGGISLEANLQGSLLRPRGELSLRSQDLELWGQPLAGAELEARMKGGDIDIDRFRLAVTREDSLDLEGRINPSRSDYDLRLSTSGISLSALKFLESRNLVEGRILVDISGSGTFRNPGARGAVSVENLVINQQPLSGFGVQLSLENRIFRGKGTMGFGLDAWYDLDKDDFFASLDFSRTELAPYLVMAGGTGLSGTLDGTIRASGKRSEPDLIRVQADLKDIMLRYRGEEAALIPLLRGNLANGTYNIEGVEARLPGEGKVRISGRGDLEGMIDFNVEGRVPAAGITPLLEDIGEAWGMLGLEAGIRGTISAPEIRGSITLDRAGLVLPVLEQRLENIQGRIDLTPGTMSLVDIRGEIEGSSVSLAGKVNMEGFRPGTLDVTAAARSLPLEIPGTLRVVVDSDLTLTGSFEKQLLRGEVTLIEGIYTRDVELNLLRSITTRSREYAPGPQAGEEPSFLNRIGLDIMLRRGEPFLVDNNLADMSLTPDLHIVGTAKQPVINGRAAVEEGVLTYQKTEFTIQKGVIDFLNPYRTEPTIDIEGETTLRDIVISLKVNGTPDNLNFSLTSDPAEEHGDLIALLLFGKTLRELRRSENGSMYSAGQILGEVLADSVASGVKGATGLDIVELEYRGNENDDIRVTIGKELSRRITVKYGAELKKGETIQKVISEYKILEEFMVSAFQNTDGNFGGTLIFRMEFW